MALPAAVLLLLLLLALLLPLAALVLGTVLLGLPSYDIPAGVNQPAKLRLVLAVLLGTAALVSGAVGVAGMRGSLPRRGEAGAGAAGATLGLWRTGKAGIPWGKAGVAMRGGMPGLAGRLAKGGVDVNRGAEPALLC